MILARCIRTRVALDPMTYIRRHKATLIDEHGKTWERITPCVAFTSDNPVMSVGDTTTIQTGDKIAATPERG